MSDDLILMHGNPLALEVPEIMEDLKQKRQAAIEVEARRENFLCKHCNIIYQGIGTETYIPVADVQACKVEHIDWTGREVYLGVDLSMTNDNTSVAMAAYDGESEKSSLMSSHSFRKGVSRRRAAPKRSTTGSLSAL